MSKYLLKSSSYLLIGQLLSMLINLGTQIVLARELFPEGRGAYALCIIYSSIFILFTNFGNEFGIRFLFLKNKINISESFLFLIITLLIALFFSLIILLMMSLFQVDVFSKTSHYQVALALFFSASSMVCRQTNVLLSLNKNFKNSALISIFDELLKFLFLFILLNKFRSIEVAFITMMLANAFTIMVYFFRFRLFQINFKNINFHNLKFIYNYGLASLFTSLSNLANAHVGTLILSIYLSNYKIGVYSVAFGLASRLQVLPDTLNRLFVPISKDEDDIIEKNLKNFSSFLLYFMIIVLFIILLFSENIIILLFGIGYIEASLVLKILSIGYLFKVLSKPLEAWYNEIKGNPIVVSKINALGIIVLSILMLIGSKYYGLIGAALATASTMTILYIILFIYHLNNNKNKFLDYYKFKNLATYILLIFNDKK